MSRRDERAFLFYRMCTMLLSYIGSRTRLSVPMKPETQEAGDLDAADAILDDKLQSYCAHRVAT